MKFVEQYRKGSESFATYLLTGVLVFLGLLIGNFVVLGLAFAIAPNMSLTSGANPFSELETNTQLVLMMLPFVFAFSALLLSVKYIHKRPILSILTARASFDWKRYFLAFTVWMSVLSLFMALTIYTTDTIHWNFNSSTFFMLLAISCVMLPIQTAVEEVFFRGWLLQGIGKRLKHAGLSILFTGIIFGLLHGGNPEVYKIGYGIFAFYILSGIFLGIIAHMDDGLELGMGYHAANNVFASIILTNDWQVFHTDALYMDTSPPSFGWDAILTLAIVQPLFLLVFAKIYKWKNWKERLFGFTPEIESDKMDDLKNEM